MNQKIAQQIIKDAEKELLEQGIDPRSGTIVVTSVKKIKNE